MMTIRSAKFVLSLDRLRAFPGQGMPEIAMAGKSNVGKSSMINSLLGNSKLARTSSEPGKTRLINFFQVNEQFWLVDLPGYGFAKAPKAERDKWGAMIEGYLEGSKHLKRVLHLVDIRHEPTAEDREMNAFLRASGLPFSVVATKADKISRGARMKHIAAICRALQVQPWEVIPFSSEDGTGRDAVLALFDRVLAPPEAAES